MMADLLSTLKPSTKLCIAADITNEGETISMMTVKEWKRKPNDIGKRPCVFLILA